MQILCIVHWEWYDLKRGQVHTTLKNTANVLKIMQLLNVFDRCEYFRNKIINFIQYGVVQYNIQCNSIFSTNSFYQTNYHY